jgi:hypothetical protein
MEVPHGRMGAGNDVALSELAAIEARRGWESRGQVGFAREGCPPIIGVWHRIAVFAVRSP